MAAEAWSIFCLRMSSLVGRPFLGASTMPEVGLTVGAWPAPPDRFIIAP